MGTGFETARSVAEFDLTSDYWVMNVDGPDKRKLTSFNDPASPQWLGHTVYCSDFSWNAGGASMICYLIYDRPGQHGRTVRIDLEV